MGKTKYTFDLANRLLTETNPLLKTTTLTYDGAENLQTKLDANGHLTTFVFDDTGRLVRSDFDDGTANQYTLDSRGNRALEKSMSHERHLHHDALNRVDVIDDVTFGKQLTFSYDAAGNRTRLSEGGVDQLFEYDARGLLAAARAGAGPRTLFGYDLLGRRSFIARPNGVRTDFLYDDGEQLLSMVHSKSGAVLLGFSYGYDGQGNRVSKTREDGTAEVYGHDTSMRLTQADYGSAKTVEYALDGLGNRGTEVQTTRPASGPNVVTTWSSTFNSWNQLRTRNRSGGGQPAVNTTIVYDDNGNTLSETAGTAVTSYAWDRDNRLRTVTPPAPGVPTQYSYDGNGLRVQRVDASGTTRYLLEGQRVLAELDTTNATVTRYLNNPQAIDDVISLERGGATYWPLTDALGSIYAVTDASGTIVRRYDFDVYGVRTDLGGTGPSIERGYTSRYLDSNGIQENRHRQRRPELGGWLTTDRSRAVDGPNLYAYVNARPSVATDPDGRTLRIYDGPARDLFDAEYGHLVGTVIPDTNLMEAYLRDMAFRGYSFGTFKLFDAEVSFGVVNLVLSIGVVPRQGATFEVGQCGNSQVLSVIDPQNTLKRDSQVEQPRGKRLFIQEVIAHELGHAKGALFGYLRATRSENQEFYRELQSAFSCDEQRLMHRLMFGSDIAAADATYVGCSSH